MKFIFMTGHGSEDDFRDCSAETGEGCYLVKPVNIEDLIRKMNELMTRERGKTMSWNWEIIGETGLQFFGKMSASISHEMKNVMAIINENAGLLEDLTVMAEKGMPIDPERLKTQASRIMKQIRRGDDIIKGMNRFAHSVDEPLRQADLNDTLGSCAPYQAALPSCGASPWNWIRPRPRFR